MRNHAHADWLALSVLTLGCIGAVVRWPALWSQDAQAGQRKPAWWPHDLAS
jgi:hypothetical protein